MIRCPYYKQPQTKAARMVFYRASVIDQINGLAFVEGETMPATAENLHGRHHVFDIAEEGNVDRVTRMMNLAHAECTEMLYPYTKVEIRDGAPEVDDRLRAPEQYRIDLTLPEGFSGTTVNLLKELIHEYMVCRVLADWMGHTKPESRRKWEEKLEEMKGKIRSSLMSRRGRTRIRMSPF